MFIKHPYLDKQAVRALIKFREFSGNQVSPSDLSEKDVIPDSIFRRILPYLEK